MSSPFEIVSVDRVYDGFFALDLARVRFQTREGKLSVPYERLCAERGDAATVLLHSVDSDEFLFVRQFRYPCVRHGDPWLIEAVAGKIDGSESPEEAVRREALEEVGFRLGEVVPAVTFYGSPGGLSELTHVFYAKVTETDRVTDGGGVDAGEDVELVRIRTGEAVRMARSGEIRDAKALVALLWFCGMEYRRPTS